MNIPLAKPIFNDIMKEAAIYALENEWFVLGESVLKFEEEFAEYCGAKYAVSVSSGTNALQLAILSTSIEPRTEVITSPASFIASANAILHANSVPKFADININTYTLDPRQVKKALSEKTRCIMPVYLYGRPADIDSFNEIGEEQGLYIIADAAQAHGAEYKNKRVGGLVDISCFSFYSSKCMTVCGDGGMVVTNNEEISELVKKFRDCGRTSEYEHDVIGYTSRLNNVNAAIGRVQLKYLNEWNIQRRKKVERYNKNFAEICDIIVPPKDDEVCRSSHYLYVIRTSKRDELKKYLEKNGIQCGIHYPIPIHLQPIYRNMYGYQEGLYSNAEILSNTVLSLPLFPQITNEEIDFICEKISEYYYL